MPSILHATIPSTPTESEVLQAVKSAFEALSRNEATHGDRSSLILPEGRGDCFVYHAYLGAKGLLGVKISPYLRSRIEAGLSPTTAYTLLLDAESGTPLLLLDSQRLTTERAAATTLVAVQLLWSGVPGKVAVVGTGQIGRAHARYARLVYPEADISVFSPLAASRSLEGEQRRQIVLDEISDARISTSAEALLQDAEVVMLCTSSATPVIDINMLGPRVLITSTGTNMPNAHEVDWKALPNMRVYCDLKDSCIRTAGDFRLAESAGTWGRSQILGDLPTLLANDFLNPLTGRTYFRATGLGIEDLAVAALLL